MAREVFFEDWFGLKIMKDALACKSENSFQTVNVMLYIVKTV